jgi:hypothetical protein
MLRRVSIWCDNSNIEFQLIPLEPSMLEIYGQSKTAHDTPSHYDYVGVFRHGDRHDLKGGSNLTVSCECRDEIGCFAEPKVVKLLFLVLHVGTS